MRRDYDEHHGVSRNPNEAVGEASADGMSLHEVLEQQLLQVRDSNCKDLTKKRLRQRFS